VARAVAGRAADRVSAVPLLVPLVKAAVVAVLSDGGEDFVGRGAVMVLSSRYLPLPLWMWVGGRSPPVCRVYEMPILFNTRRLEAPLCIEGSVEGLQMRAVEVWGAAWELGLPADALMAGWSLRQR
jgi:hypothetical protein